MRVAEVDERDTLAAVRDFPPRGDRGARFSSHNSGAQAARVHALSPRGGMASPRLELPLHFVQNVKDVIASSSAWASWAPRVHVWTSR